MGNDQSSTEALQPKDDPFHIPDPESYAHSSSWMKALDSSKRLTSLILPGSHNSGSFITKDPLGPVGRFVQCQEHSFYRQLMSGVRSLDIRVSLFKTGDGVYELWCAHTFLTVPFERALFEAQWFVS